MSNLTNPFKNHDLVPGEPNMVHNIFNTKPNIFNMCKSQLDGGHGKA